MRQRRPGTGISTASASPASISCWSGLHGAWHALSDECTHAGCLLSEDGELLDGVLICNCHGSEFVPASGELVMGPADAPLETFAVRVVEGRVEVELPEG